jgi:hypothetical protein
MEYPTDKQINRIDRLINYKGIDFVRNYFYIHFPNSNFDTITKSQAQKIITGLHTYEDRKPILGVFGRDVF